MSSPQVLRILKKDGSGGHLLVHIVPQGRSKTLDLKLTGTDSADSLYTTSITESSTKELKKLQSGNFHGSLDEWKTLLAFVLLHKRPQEPLPEYLQGVEIVAEVDVDTFSITIRKSVDSISQRLGSIILQREEEEEVNLFRWIDAAAASSDQLRLQLQTFQTSSTKQQEQIASLTAELNQLVKAKREHEQELLSKFAALLNEKKLKIRDQQRLLSHAKVDADAADDIKNERAKDHISRKARASRSKRKAIEDSDEEEEEQQEQTPVASDAETTEDESDDDFNFAPVAPASQASSRRSAALQQSQPAAPMDVDEDSLPPRRDLPFSRPSAKAPTPTSSSTLKVAEEEDDEETDDEL